MLRRSMALACVLIASACSGDDTATKAFGAEESPCAATVLSNDPLTDADALAEGSDCFLTEFRAGRSVVWDLLVPTVEGDPIVWRYDFDGEFVTITEDQSRDEFGSAGVTERRCRGVRPGSGAFLEGEDCESAPGDGFRSDSLPTG